MVDSITADEIQQDKSKLQEILSRAEFSSAKHEGSNVLDLFGRAIRYVLNQIGKLFPDHFLPSNSGVVILISYLVILAGLGLLVYLIYWFSSQLIVHRRLSKQLFLSEEELLLSFKSYLQRAKLSEDESNWKEGVRHLFLALLFYCNSRDWVVVEKWKTNGEYKEELRLKQSAVLDVFTEGSVLFDKVWYGKQEIHSIDFTSFFQRIKPIVMEDE